MMMMMMMMMMMRMMTTTTTTTMTTLVMGRSLNTPSTDFAQVRRRSLDNWRGAEGLWVVDAFDGGRLDG